MGVVIFGSKLSHLNNPLETFYLGYSFAFLCVSGLLAAVAGLVTLADIITNKTVTVTSQTRRRGQFVNGNI